MASSNGAARRKRFVFADCRSRPVAYYGVARVAGFTKSLIQGRMVVNIELYPSKVGVKKRAAKRARTGRARSR